MNVIHNKIAFILRLTLFATFSNVSSPNDIACVPLLPFYNILFDCSIR